MSRDKTGRSKWSHELVENSNAMDRFFQGANTLVILVVTEFQNNYLREYNTQLSRFVFYLNRPIPINLSKLSISGELHVLNEMLNLQNGSEEGKIPNIHGNQI